MGGGNAQVRRLGREGKVSVFGFNPGGGWDANGLRYSLSIARLDEEKRKGRRWNKRRTATGFRTNDQQK